ncbi:F0F1 ATP synthase subunit A [Collinsella sp. AF25-2LB]|uniref:F0F1 ATP synthase subunit A n=1 Tax=Collinsella sp. AF25-2LB TaxID=2292226 RepID=UPI000E557A49|nr:F0F1 ATP synthase subunit A [Collinsella sp. AF25-2LB]RGR38329.1 ATP synthase F0 subunit A [Collinsella sp. AF25-2LB]
MEIFEKLPDEINHLVSEFSSTPVVGDLSCGITQYSFWLIVSTIVLLIVLAVFKKKQALVPKGFFVNGFEYIIEYVENDIGKGVVGENWKKHFPFLCSLFLFILINNMIGLIPGMKPGTGAIGSTAALAIFAFVYFIYYGCKAHGVIGYIKSLAPQGVSFPMNVLVWVVELFSTFLRLITLAVRLFCNMFAGHVVMGSFAIMASMFMQPLLQQASAAHAVGALPSLAWLAILILIYAIELVVGAIQAYVFTVLTAVYVSEAEEVAEEE